MIEIAERRDILQAVNLLVAIAAMIYTIYLARGGRLAWGYVFIPVCILIQIIMLYFYVLVTDPLPSISATFISGAIRFQELFGYLIVLRGIGSRK